MCNREKTHVKPYSGYKANERPVSFTAGGRSLNIENVIESWHEPGWMCFRVLADDGKVYVLRYDEFGDEWGMEACNEKKG